MSTLNTAAHDLRDIKALRPPPASPWPTVLAWGAAALCVALVGWLAWRSWGARRRNKPPQDASRSAQDVALAALAALYQVNFADVAAIRHYYFAISEVMRSYVEARFALTATQLTTEEIFAKLPSLVELAPDQDRRLRRFLADTDPVKYAQHQPTPENIGTAHADAVAFIKATVPPCPPDQSSKGRA